MLLPIDWYSTEAYYLVKSLVDLIPNIAVIATFTMIEDTVYDYEDTLPALLLTFILLSIVCQSMGHICAVLFENNAVIASIITSPFVFVFSNLFLNSEELGDVLAHLTQLNPVRHALNYMLVFFYGDHRCSDDQISAVMKKFVLDEDVFDKSWHSLIILVFLFRILTYICLKFKVNSDLISIKIKELNDKIIDL